MAGRDIYLSFNFWGLILGLGGLFLPWGDTSITAYMPTKHLWGFQLLFGDSAFIGSVIVAIFLYRYAKYRRGRLSTLVLLGSLIVIFSCLLWFLDSKSNVTYLSLIAPYGLVTETAKEWPGLQVGFGAYITLIGGFVMAASIFGRWIIGEHNLRQTATFESPSLVSTYSGRTTGECKI